MNVDLNDPNIEIKSLAAINKTNTNTNNNNNNVNLDFENNVDNSHLYQDIFASIVKGSMGFGFTIADDIQNKRQKIKQILDRERCVHLNEDDILCEINGLPLDNLSHLQIVDLLKECPKGQETLLKLKRLKSVNNMKQTSGTSIINFIISVVFFLYPKYWSYFRLFIFCSIQYLRLTLSFGPSFFRLSM